VGYNGYGVKTMPGIREAIEQRNWKEAQEQIVLLADTVNKLAAYFGSDTINGFMSIITPRRLVGRFCF
jgi:Transferrin receptor-like dimerisation domain